MTMLRHHTWRYKYRTIAILTIIFLNSHFLCAAEYNQKVRSSYNFANGFAVVVSVYSNSEQLAKRIESVIAHDILTYSTNNFPYLADKIIFLDKNAAESATGLLLLVQGKLAPKRDIVGSGDGYILCFSMEILQPNVAGGPIVPGAQAVYIKSELELDDPESKSRLTLSRTIGNQIKLFISN